MHRARPKLIALLALAAFVFGQSVVSPGIGLACRAAAHVPANCAACCGCAEEQATPETEGNSLASPCPEHPAHPVCPDGCIWCVAKAPTSLPVQPLSMGSSECLSRLAPDSAPRIPTPPRTNLTPPPRS